MKDKIIEKWIKWKEDKDEGYIYDECFEFINLLTRGELVQFLNELVDSQTKQDEGEK